MNKYSNIKPSQQKGTSGQRRVQRHQEKMEATQLEHAEGEYGTCPKCGYDLPLTADREMVNSMCPDCGWPEQTL